MRRTILASSKVWRNVAAGLLGLACCMAAQAQIQLPSENPFRVAPQAAPTAPQPVLRSAPEVVDTTAMPRDNAPASVAAPAASPAPAPVFEPATAPAPAPLQPAAQAPRALPESVTDVGPLVESVETAVEASGAVAVVGPGDTLSVSVLGQPELDARLTIDAEGRITVPFLGELDVSGLAPTEVGRRVAEGLRKGGYLQDPKVAVDVLRVRSRVASILGEVNRPGRYAIEGRLTLLELLAMAGGVREGASDTAVLIRPGIDPFTQQRVELFVGNRQLPARQIQNVVLQAGDVVFLAQAPRFYVHGEVSRSGSFPVEPDLTVMRAIAIAGGMTQRASDGRISINRKGPDGAIVKIKAKLDDAVLPGDVVFVDERFF